MNKEVFKLHIISSAMAGEAAFGQDFRERKAEDRRENREPVTVNFEKFDENLETLGSIALALRAERQKQQAMLRKIQRLLGISRTGKDDKVL